MHQGVSTGVGALRAVLLAAAVVGLAGAGHLLSGGAAPPWRAVVLSLLVVSVLSTATASRRVSPWRLAVVVGGGQVVLHHALSSGDGGHHPSLLEATTSPDLSMVAAHAVATVVTVLAVQRGEGAARALLAWAGARPITLPHGVIPSASVPPPVRALLLAPGRRVVDADPARGPPAGCALAV
ncbi:hypothetical protein [Aquipuribacter sp. MA13-6]|uniref:hypothetical protein n=1 Tax=unclassified Aquipuribacter TaxID=2635084 RepID=UPI003EECC1EC